MRCLRGYLLERSANSLHMVQIVLYCIVFILRNTFILTHYDIDNMSKVLCSDGQTGVKRLRLPKKHTKLGQKNIQIV